METPLYKLVDPRKLRLMFEDFYNRVFEDVMIGYLFKGRNKKRLVEKELEFTLEALGAEVPYTGRPMERVHLPLRIMKGHFDRRQKILEETLVDHQIPQAVIRACLSHDEGIREQIIGDQSGACIAK